MRLSDFHYTLPPELIAQTPEFRRDQARLLVYHRLSGEIKHKKVADLPELLPKGTVLVANNTKVRHSRLYASYLNHPREILALEEVSTQVYRCLIGGRIKPKAKLSLYADQQRQQPLPSQAEVLTKEEHPAMNTFLVRFSGETAPEELFNRFGQVPLPPYIKDSRAPAERYQTIFASVPGSAAAPTAGLHLTWGLIQQLRQAGFGWEEVTLQVGAGTFLPLRQEEITENRLHREQTFITPETAASLRNARPILAIGTTTTRTLEANFQNGAIQPGAMTTDLFIYPGYVFQSVNLLLTNFHLPASSLLLLVAAFLGNHPYERKLILNEKQMAEKLKELYALAIQEKYRFYSFGDAMLIL